MKPDKQKELREMVNDNDKFTGWIAGLEVATILAVPGVMELCLEELNNDWIAHCEEIFGEEYNG
jgi:hypothetical protein